MGFCEHCGKELADGEVCNCTTNNKQTVNEQPTSSENKGDQTAEQVSQAISQVTSQAEDVVGKVKGMVGDKKWLLAVPVAVIVLIVVVALFSGSGGYMSPVKDFMSLVNKKSTKSIEYQTVMMPDFLAKAYKDFHKKCLKSDEYVDNIDNQADVYEELYEDMDDELGKWKLTFESKGKEKIDKDDLEDIQEDYEDYFDDYVESQIEDYEDILEDDDDLEDWADDADMSEKNAKAAIKSQIKLLKKYEKMKVTAGYEVKGRFIIKTKDEEYKTSTIKFRVLKVNGDWCYAGTVDGSYIRFDLEEAAEDVSVSRIESLLNSSYLY